MDGARIIFKLSRSKSIHEQAVQRDLVQIEPADLINEGQFDPMLGGVFTRRFRVESEMPRASAARVRLP